MFPLLRLEAELGLRSYRYTVSQDNLKPDFERLKCRTHEQNAAVRSTAVGRTLGIFFAGASRRSILVDLLIDLRVFPKAVHENNWY